MGGLHGYMGSKSRVEQGFGLPVLQFEKTEIQNSQCRQWPNGIFSK